MNNELTSNENVHIKQLKMELAFLQWFILALGIIILITFSLSNHLFENIIFLPIIGLIGYLFTRHIFILPSITTLLLLLTRFLMDWVSPDVDPIINYLFYFFIFFSLTLLGSLCGYFLRKSIKYFNQFQGIKKIGILFSWIILSLIIMILLINFITINGNPISTYLAECRMQWHLKNTYPDEDIQLSNIQYYFKEKAYTATASLYNETDAYQSFELKYMNGHVTDDYFEIYLEDIPNEYRLNRQITNELSTLLSENQIDSSIIESNLQISKKSYDNIDFDKTTFDVPLALTFTLITDKKQSYDEFSTWCEKIRSLLINEGYSLDSLCFNSNPHWEDNSLVLYLSDEQLSQPISDITSYDHFTDLGVSHGLTESDHNPAPYNDYYDNRELAVFLESTLALPSATPVYVTASDTSLGNLKLEIFWTGKRISIDSYADTTLKLFNQLMSENLLEGYSFQSITFKYGWGTKSESYEYTIYPENVDIQSTDMIIDTLLN